MELSFSTAQNGLYAANLKQSAIADNLSNLTTTGFKARRAEQTTLAGPGTRIESVRPDFTVGAPEAAPNDTDLYLAGEGFFRVQLDGAVAYTRAGSFHVDRDGNLVTPSGHLLEPQITVPEGSAGVQVTKDGQVFAIDGAGNAALIGEIDLATFINPAGLSALGNDLYAETANSGAPVSGVPGEAGFGTIEQRFLESSNVDAAEELTDMIVNQRYYQMNLRVFQTSDSLVGRAIDLFS
ncbi:MAG: flagellar hook-basal body complex protein [Planctomycetes bacterium]|nr:flagellar hook-basal body complex protein [Planctomycetota bacterium]